MKAIKFTIGGKSACFKKPDVNAEVYFTYNNIPKPTLLGMLGSIVGYDGYTQLSRKNKGYKETDLQYIKAFPEFYEKFKDLKIAIIPLSQNGYFPKKIHTYNNTTGFASHEDGGNLIVKEQWIENPKWEIIIASDDSEQYKLLKKYLLSQKAVYIPYLGKNNHPVIIKNVEEIALKPKLKNARFYSLFFANKCKLDGITDFDRLDELEFTYEEFLPISLQKDYHFYELEKLIFSNSDISNDTHDTVYSYQEKNYAFI